MVVLVAASLYLDRRIKISAAPPIKTIGEFRRLEAVFSRLEATPVTVFPTAVIPPVTSWTIAAGAWMTSVARPLAVPNRSKGSRTLRMALPKSSKTELEWGVLEELKLIRGIPSAGLILQ